MTLRNRAFFDTKGVLIVLTALLLSALVATACSDDSAGSSGLDGVDAGSLTNVRNGATVSAAAVLPVQSQSGSGEISPYVAVVGTNSFDVEPDRALVALSVESRGDEVVPATNTATEAKDRIIAELEDMDGVGSFQSSINVRQDYVWNERLSRSVPNGFIVTYNIRFEVLSDDNIDLGEATGGALASAVTAGGDLLRINSVDFTLTNAALETFSRTARRQAAMNAKLRADDYTSALGASTGRVLTISESSAAQPTPLFAPAVAAFADTAARESVSAGSFSLEQGLVTVSASVSVAFAID